MAVLLRFFLPLAISQAVVYRSKKMDLDRTLLKITSTAFQNVRNRRSHPYNSTSIEHMVERRSIAVPQQFYNSPPFSFDPGSQAGGASACSLPQQIGTGPYRIPRWYYNSARMRCELFYWSGCCANGNNFPSMHNCQRLCEVDPCTQEMDEGRGSIRQRRYYFNKYTKMCEQFDYRGADGNRNNFENLQDCQLHCPEAPNPCAYGSSMPLIPCQGGNVCGTSQFCHIGLSQPTTVCCNRPPYGDRCSQTLKTGMGSASLQRWYFNSNSQSCAPFIYRGLQGNENNFLNQYDCESACSVNPCAAGSPYRNKEIIMQCLPTSASACPPGYYCHIGAEPQTTVCCPNLGGNPCEQQMDHGQGKYQLQRWYWNVANQRCMPFVYGGLKGTQNNFLNQEACERTCYVFENPCASGRPQQGANNRPLSCVLTQTVCASTYWCHIGAAPQTTVCCPGRVNGPAICKLPLAVGSGNANLQRWYFDINTQNCVPFSYGGMLGNQNNFPSQQYCQQTCPGFINPCLSGTPQLSPSGRPVSCGTSFDSCGSTFWCHIGAAPQTTLCCPGQVHRSEICKLSLSIGTGGSNLQRWYFDSSTQRCLPFSYGGLYGNQNNFLTQQQCQQVCPVFVNPCASGNPQPGPNNGPQFCTSQNHCASGYWCHIGAVQETTVCCPGRVNGYAICQAPMVTGTGDASLQRWYYNAESRQCLPFVYKGMMGNQNNFQNKQECQLACPAYVNVCPQGVPLLELSTNQPRRCAFGDNSCGPNHWCHLGLVPDEYQCCPGAETNPAACQGLPYAVGVFGAPAPPVTRWYYDKITMSCKPFEYCGRKGNQNNFPTAAICADICKVFVNPCNQPVALPPRTCSTSWPCATGSYCHYGLTPETTICCPFEGNRCQLPMTAGYGTGSVLRWYFNSERGVCEQFTYHGLGGNANNFLTRENCEIMCRPNPCAEGQPYKTQNGTYQSCDISLQINVCPSGYWCNPGSGPLTSVCCPGAVNDPCSLPMKIGEGSEELERYYYDAMTKTCRVFTYRGMKGNQNNFLSLAACQQKCQPLENPCIGQPATTASGQIVFCSSTNKEMCPVNYWCHVGATPETTVCCPGATNPCSVPLSPGTGNADLSRWYYNSDDRECLPFQYNGKRGNQNNFESQAECARTCPVFSNLCIGKIARDENGKPRTCNPLKTNPCGSGYFCLTGNSRNRKSYCCSSQTEDPCSVYLNEGEGDDELQRWYFSSEQRECSPFLYRGLKGNENNFVTKYLCEQTCKPDSRICSGGTEPLRVNGRIVSCSNSSCPETHYCHIGNSPRSTVCCMRQGNVCAQQLTPGVGPFNLIRWYYDASQDQCRNFHYTGLGGNENNFLTRTECETACPRLSRYCIIGKPLVVAGEIIHCDINVACPRGYTCHAPRNIITSPVCCPDSEQLCLLSIDRGTCGEQQTRYAFDRQQNQCVPFEYTGCGGNLNNFHSLSECISTCGKVGF